MRGTTCSWLFINAKIRIYSWLPFHSRSNIVIKALLQYISRFSDCLWVNTPFLITIHKFNSSNSLVHWHSGGYTQLCYFAIIFLLSDSTWNCNRRHQIFDLIYTIRNQLYTALHKFENTWKIVLCPHFIDLSTMFPTIVFKSSMYSSVLDLETEAIKSNQYKRILWSLQGIHGSSASHALVIRCTTQINTEKFARIL